MPLIFRTEKDASAVEIAGAGVAGPDGKGGVHVEAAAEVMPELQDEGGRPLSGAKLKSAAEDFAEARGLKVVSGSDAVVAGLAQEVGGPPETQDAREASIEAGRALLGTTEQETEASAELLAEGTATAAEEPQEA